MAPGSASAPAALAASRRWFGRHGAAVVFWGRVIPGVRTFVSVPAGIELMPQPAFLAWTAAGSALWVSALTVAGLALGPYYGRVLAWLEPIGGALLAGITVAIGLAALMWLWRRP